MTITINLSSTDVQESYYSSHETVGILTVSGLAEGETLTGFVIENNYSGEYGHNIFFVQYSEGQYLLKALGGEIDFENANLNRFPLTIKAMGANGTTLQTSSFTINVTDGNDNPTGIDVSGGTISDTAAVGDEVATLSAVDQDANDSHTYILVDHTGYNTPLNHPFFKIENNKIVLKAALGEAQVGTHDLWVQVKDSEGLSRSERITITVTDGGTTPPDNPAPVPAPTNGTPKNDRLSGTEGADVLNGLSGNDKIFGLGGDDIINGGAGKDQLYGGAGMDTFVFDSRAKKGQFDHVKDFVSADDTLQFDLSALKSFKVKSLKKDLLAFAKKGKGKDDMGKPDKKKVSVGLDKVFKEGKLDKKFFKIGKPKDVNDFVTYDKKKGVVYLDVDGSGKAKGIEILKVKPGTTITADDFLFI
ncbi:calcium-binding protein [Microvirga sp. GCM10011540]|uniref:calcium-binding protein n=1 Tax=Microvirga sp. GCM10011540 TaxID=3317338 RepID=UPI003610C649